MLIDLFIETSGTALFSLGCRFVNVTFRLEKNCVNE